MSVFRAGSMVTVTLTAPPSVTLWDALSKPIVQVSSSSMVITAERGLPSLTPAGSLDASMATRKVSSASHALSSVVRTVPVAVVSPAGTVRVRALESKSTSPPVAERAVKRTLTAVAVERARDRTTPTVAASPSATVVAGGDSESVGGSSLSMV